MSGAGSSALMWGTSSSVGGAWVWRGLSALSETFWADLLHGPSTCISQLSPTYCSLPQIILLYLYNGFCFISISDSSVFYKELYFCSLLPLIKWRSEVKTAFSFYSCARRAQLPNSCLKVNLIGWLYFHGFMAEYERYCCRAAGTKWHLLWCEICV